MSCNSSDPLSLALAGLRPDDGPGPEAAPARTPDDLDLSALEADGQDWAGFSVDRDSDEDATMIAVAADDFDQVAGTAAGRALTRRDLLADLLRAVVSNLNANRAMLESDRLRQQAQVQRLVRAMMSSIAASGEDEARAEDTAQLLMAAMSAAGRGARRRSSRTVRGG